MRNVLLTILLVFGATSCSIPAGVGQSASTVPTSSTSTVNPTVVPTTLVTPTKQPERWKIIFESDREGMFSIYQMNSDGSNVEKITPDGLAAISPSLHPDGQQLLFIAKKQLFILDLKDRSSRQITTDKIYRSNPAWSPNGDEIVYVSRGSKGDELHIMSIDGSYDTTIFSVTRPLNQIMMPTWSPDGQRLAFMAKPNGLWDVIVVDRDGANVEQLTTDPLNDWAPAWSPDGQFIAFASDRDDGLDPAIYRMNADGTDQQRITEIGGNDTAPAWSSDGKMLVFVSFRDKDKQGDIYRVQADGSDLKKLTNEADNWKPVWHRLYP